MGGGPHYRKDFSELIFGGGRGGEKSSLNFFFNT